MRSAHDSTPQLFLRSAGGGERKPLSAEDVKLSLRLRIEQWKNYPEAAMFVACVFSDSLHVWKEKNPSYTEAELTAATNTIVSSFSLDTLSPETLQKIFSVKLHDYPLIESFANWGYPSYNPSAISFLVNQHKQISDNDSEHYQQAFEKLMRDLKYNSAERMSIKKKEIVAACGVLLSTKNVTANWYLYSNGDTSIMNQFALYGMTEYFKQGMAKGVSIGPQKAGLNFCTRESFSETPLDIALKHNQQAIIDIINTEMKKKTENTILEMILQKQLSRPTVDDQHKHALQNLVFEAIRSNFFIDGISNISDRNKVGNIIHDFFTRWSQAEKAGKQALDEAVLNDKNFRFTKKLLNTVINSMRDIFNCKEFAGTETILDRVAHRIIGEKKSELARAYIEEAKKMRDRNEIHWPSFQEHLIIGIKLHSTDIPESGIKLICKLNPNNADDQRKMAAFACAIAYCGTISSCEAFRRYLVEHIFNYKNILDPFDMKTKKELEWQMLGASITQFNSLKGKFNISDMECSAAIIELRTKPQEKAQLQELRDISTPQQPVVAAGTFNPLDDAQLAVVLAEMLKPLETRSVLQGVVSPTPADEANALKGIVVAPATNPYSFVGGLTDFGRQQKDLKAARETASAISSAAPATNVHPTHSDAREEEMADVRKLQVPKGAIFVLPAAQRVAVKPAAQDGDEELRKFQLASA